MSRIDELIKLRPELKPLKPHIGNALADNYALGLRGRYHTRLDRGIQIATRAKSNQLAGVVEQLLADRAKRGSGAPFSIYDVRDEELLMRTLILALWSSRAVPPSSVNGTVQVKGNVVYGNEHFIPGISLADVKGTTTPDPDSSGIEEQPQAKIATASELPSASPVSIESASPSSLPMSGGARMNLFNDVEHVESFIQRAEEIFLHPKRQYGWNDIITGVMVSLPAGYHRRFMAVDRNTFRGFHKIDKSGTGAGEVFRSYFVQQRGQLIAALHAARSTDDLHVLLNRVSDDICAGLVNIKPIMLASYNKIRKPVDLYIEHLVAMAHELDACREQLISLISLPLDSQMFEHPDVFQDSELRRVGISRNSTYMAVGSEAAYRYLQSVLKDRAEELSQTAGQRYYPIYFDLLWNNRYARHGSNLFELNP